ncbi:MAG: TRAP transporter small permease [Synergistaceae bacterium]|nr:TRAP transporter small permease [Synergistaceae bacterium]
MTQNRIVGIATAFLKVIGKWVRKILRVLAITLFAVLALLLLLNVGLRLSSDLSNWLIRMGFPAAAAAVKAVIPITSFHWFDEIVELCFASLVFYGSASLWTSGGHFSVGDWISPHLPGEKTRTLYRLFTSCISVAFLAVFFWFSLKLVMRSTELTTVFQMPKSLLYSCMPVSSFIMLCYSAADVCLHAKRFFKPTLIREQ